MRTNRPGNAVGEWNVKRDVMEWNRAMCGVMSVQQTNKTNRLASMLAAADKGAEAD